MHTKRGVILQQKKEKKKEIIFLIGKKKIVHCKSIFKLEDSFIQFIFIT